MQTLVLFEVQKSLFSIMLEELSLVPTRGNFYILDNNRLEIAEVTEYLGQSKIAAASPNGSNTILLEVLQAMSADAEQDQALRLSSIQPLGKLAGKLYSKSPAGIITAKPFANPEFDNVLYVKLKLVVSTLKKSRRQSTALSSSESEEEIGSPLRLSMKDSLADTAAANQAQERKTRQAAQ